MDSGCRASTNNNGYFATFDSVESSILSTADLYIRKYAGKPPDEITRVYAGNPQSKGYWTAIRACYGMKE